jgi:hypothetical protein
MGRRLTLALGTVLLAPLMVAGPTSASVQQRLRIVVVNRAGSSHVHVAAAPACTPLSLSVTHAGSQVAAPGPSGSVVDLAAPVAAGDQIAVACGGKMVTFTYDGLPSIGPSACGGSQAIDGTVSPGSYLILALARPGIDVPYTRASQVATLSSHGPSYRGTFARPILATDVLRADEALQGFVNGIYVAYFAITERTAGVCSTSSPPSGSVRLAHHRHLLRELLHGGLVTLVTDNQAGTVIENLYLDNGARLPAQATRTPGPILIGRASVALGKPGRVTLKLRPTKAGKRRLKGKRSVKVVLIATARNGAGGSRTFAAQHLTLAR